ncbi:type III secretion system inner membrane ring lipoprotein SctJ [Kosakonia sp. MUSA4]|uniref:type III secretion system inner membrane ring lipoprotein SctJ n=1 Tax=Kosakonia sp. MUSA4 TaxID=2067958 RepID=UPI0008D19AC3|nr:type III secretion inner membrane ring lipoprotein SctJ [Kosakonia sp. MUSA4]QJT82635.1 EscJ/YscJ/HrcJ family type III secretion inner membrane ring protein [Kosakonia sp. MUSA4]SEK22124.1 type III secretion protein J [Kosakonia sacchari]
MQKFWRKSLLAALLALSLTGCNPLVVLNTGLSENDANDIIAELSRYNIAVDKQIDKEGVTIRVDSDDIARSVQILNTSGLPHKARTNLGEEFQKSGIISSPLEEQARYIFALSQELEATLSQIDGVVVARVSVVLAERVAPGEPVQPASASVFIKHTPDLDPDSIRPRIRQLVAASIPGLAGKSDDVISIVFVPAEVYHDHIEQVILGPFRFTLSEYATVKQGFFIVLGLLLLTGAVMVLKPRIQKRLAKKKLAAASVADSGRRK